MLNFDFKTLSAFLNENKSFLINSRLQKIQQPSRTELLFQFRNNGQSKKFYININPQFFHICFLSAENEIKRRISIPQNPPMFCMLLRKYLDNSKISKISQPDGERILEFYVETYNELSEKIYICLAIELMGKHSNVILYNYDTNLILGCMHNVGPEKSSVRELSGGLPYCYPPKKSNHISEYFFDKLNLSENINSQIDNHFSSIQELEKIKTLKSKLTTLTNSKLKKSKSTFEKILKQSKTQEKTNFQRKKGDLIMANLFHNKDFSSSIEVTDYETNSPLKIELDESLTLKENANRFYKLYTKYKNAEQKFNEMKDELICEKEYLEQVLYTIEASKTIDELLEVEAELAPRNVLSKPANGGRKAKKSNEATKPLSLNIQDFTVLLGRNNKQNDYILRTANPQDLWFHAHNCAGSHVLLKINEQKPNNKIIYECAKLAKEHSKGQNSKTGVIYTCAKNLKRPPASPLGYVTYKGEEEIII